MEQNLDNRTGSAVRQSISWWRLTRLQACKAAISVCFFTAIIMHTGSLLAAAENIPLHAANASLDRLTDWISIKFDEVPTIMLGSLMALAVPSLALLGWFVCRQTAPGPARQEVTARSIPLSGWNMHGLLLVANRHGESYEIRSGLLRIGREQDNDIQLLHKTVHRYHAIVERTPEAEFYIFNVSGTGGNGMRIDGKKLQQARLRGGELIELGKERLRFQLAGMTDR